MKTSKIYVSGSDELKPCVLFIIIKYKLVSCLMPDGKTEKDLYYDSNKNTDLDDVINFRMVANN